MLIKSILMALYMYVMSALLLPLEGCENLASIIAQFWWSSNPPERGIHWKKMEKAMQIKRRGSDRIQVDP